MKIVNETIRGKKKTKSTRQETLSLMSELEQKQGEMASLWYDRGLDEKTADFLSLNPEFIVYGVLEVLRDECGLD